MSGFLKQCHIDNGTEDSTGIVNDSTGKIEKTELIFDQRSRRILQGAPYVTIDK
jgi:hypothetical protein